MLITWRIIPVSKYFETPCLQNIEAILEGVPQPDP